MSLLRFPSTLRILSVGSCISFATQIVWLCFSISVRSMSLFSLQSRQNDFLSSRKVERSLRTSSRVFGAKIDISISTSMFFFFINQRILHQKEDLSTLILRFIISFATDCRHHHTFCPEKFSDRNHFLLLFPWKRGKEMQFIPERQNYARISPSSISLLLCIPFIFYCLEWKLGNEVLVFAP